MNTVIYADILVAVNILLTYILLVASRVVVKCDTSKYGIVASSLLGGFSSLIIFWESIPLWCSVFYRLIVGVAIVYLAFLPKTMKYLFKCSLGFFLVNFIFGGIIYFVEVNFSASDIIYMNGTVYFDVSLLFLVSMTLLSYGILLVFDYFLKRRVAKNTLYKVRIFYNNKSCEVTALLDTGNHLTDGLEGKPVIICELNSLVNLFSYDEITFLKQGSISGEVPTGLKGRFRLIPCNSVAGSAVLKAIVPQRVIIKDGKTDFSTDFIIIGIVNGKLSACEYDCLLNFAVFERGKRSDDILVEK